MKSHRENYRSRDRSEPGKTIPNQTDRSVQLSGHVVINVAYICSICITIVNLKDYFEGE